MEIYESGNSEPWGGEMAGTKRQYISCSYQIPSTCRFAPHPSSLVPPPAYGFNLAHKHIPEMSLYSGLSKNPIFQPAVGSFPQGMVVNVPLHYEWLKPGVSGKDMHKALKEHYAGSKFITVKEMGNADDLERGAFLRPDSLTNTNKMELFVFANDDTGQAVLCARLDNLGKGASGAAVQNMNIALGLDESAGL